MWLRLSLNSLPLSREVGSRYPALKSGLDFVNGTQSVEYGWGYIEAMRFLRLGQPYGFCFGLLQHFFLES